MNNTKRILPMGILVFTHHDETGLVERAPYMTEGDLCKAFSDALDSGFPVQDICPYVRADREDVANKLYDLMQRKCGAKYSVLQLTKSNLESVLDTHTFVIPTSTKKG